MVDYINYMAPAIYPWNPQSLASSDSSNFQKTQKPCAGVHGPNEHDGPESWRKDRPLGLAFLNIVGWLNMLGDPWQILGSKVGH